MFSICAFLRVVLLLTAMAGVLAGSYWMWAGFLVSCCRASSGDAVLGDDIEEPYKHPTFLCSRCGQQLPLLITLSVAFAWMLGSGDPLGWRG